MSTDTAAFVKTMIDTLTEHKGEAICELDLKGITDVAEFVVVCSATSNRHASTLADYCWVAAKSMGIEPLGKEGTDDNEWILLDFGHVIVHVMLHKVRDYYNLEDMWCLKPAQHED